MYICSGCGYISHETATYNEIHLIGEGIAYETLQSLECPFCHSDMDSAEKCSVCDEIKSAEDNMFYGGICDDCLREKAKDLDTVIKCAKLCASKETVKVNPFLTFMLAPESVENILWDYFNKACNCEGLGQLLRGLYQKKAEEWAKEDLSWFGDILEEVMKNEHHGA